MIHRVYWDIETAPTENARDFCREPKDKRNKSIDDQLADAALSAITGKVMLIGCLVDTETQPRWFEGCEDYILQNFWDFFNTTRSTMQCATWIGFNSQEFDFPFVVQRSYINGIKPAQVFNGRGYMDDRFVDLRKLWQCGNRQSLGSLNTISRAMGIGSKTGDGAKFAELYGNPETKQQALDYCLNDLMLTRKIAERML